MSVELDDLRQEDRKVSQKVVTVRYVNPLLGNRKETHECSSRDMSKGGLKLISHHPLSLDSELPMEIDLGSMWAVVNIQGKVKWCLEIDDIPTYYIGVKLMDVEHSNLQVWQEFIESD